MAGAPKGWIPRVAGIVAFVVAFFVVFELKQNWTEKKAAERVSAQIDKMKAEATKEKPDVPALVTLQEKMTKLSEAQLATESGEQKAETASRLYFGFYAMNIRARPAFCKEQGVDIPAWTAAFKKVNAPETARAREIFAKTGFDEDHEYGLFADHAKKLVADDMDSIANAYKVSVPDACKLFQEHADEFAAQMSFADVQPVVYRAVMTP